MRRIWKRRSTGKPRILVIRLGLAASVVIAASAVVIALIGNVPNRQWNTTHAESVRRFTDAKQGVPYSMSVVELDDQGVMWNPQQLQWSLDHLRESFSAHPAGSIVVVFVHGWKNDAAWSEGGEGRLQQFCDELEGIAARVVDGGEGNGPPGIVGVYIGWRGRSFTFPGMENLTFWNRRVAAHRAASIDLLEILLKINQLVRSEPHVKVVVMGHSMGGLIVEKVLAPSIVTSAISGSDASRYTPIDFDLVVSLNPATSALDTNRLMDFFERNKIRTVTVDNDGRIEPARGPLMVSINSEADLVNRVSFPLGMWINALFLRYRTETTPGEPSQRTLGIRAAGHQPSLISHTADIVDGRLVLTTREGHRDDAPYWVIQVTKEISSGHSDVTNSRLRSLVHSLMERNRVLDPDVQLALQTVESEVL